MAARKKKPSKTKRHTATTRRKQRRPHKKTTRKKRSRKLQSLAREGDKILCGRLRKLRQAKKVTQHEMAQLVGIPYESYCGYERGDARAPFSRIRQIAMSLQVSIDYLAGLTKSRHRGSRLSDSLPKKIPSRSKR